MSEIEPGPTLARRLESWPLDRLRPYNRNPRTHPSEQVEKIASSIVRFGFCSPILVDDSDGIVAGHGRYAAAQMLELEVVPVVVLDHLTPEQRRAYLLADNQLGELSSWDPKLLEVELGELDDLGVELADLGFDPGELDVDLGDDPLEEAPAPGPAAADEADHAQQVEHQAPKAVSVPGDLWDLGGHQIAVGDDHPERCDALLRAWAWQGFSEPIHVASGKTWTEIEKERAAASG